MTEHIILLHGLWMRGFSMLALRRRLLESDFDVHGFEYASVAGDARRCAARLRSRMLSLAGGNDANVHLVGHSLGGIIALRSVLEGDELPSGRIVCLGTPLTGSAVARHFAHMPIGRLMFGSSERDLLDGISVWNGAREVGVIAGSTPHGLGALFGQFEGDHDGTVAVAETRLPGIADHCVVPASHTGLLFSPEAAEETAIFLHTGRFKGN